MPLEVATDGEFAVRPSERRGALRTDPDHPHHFRFASGERYFPLGNTAYNLLSALERVPDEAEAFLAYYAARGFNWVRFFLSQASWATTGGFVWPWGGTPDAPDYDTFSLNTFRTAERALQLLAGHASIGSVLLLHPRDPAMRRLSEGGSEAKLAVFRSYFRYAVARLGAFENAVWNVANEWNAGDSLTQEEAEALGAFLREIDPYGRLIACHHAGPGRFHFPHAAWCDMSSLQHRGRPHEIYDMAKLNRTFGKPVMNDTGCWPTPS